MLDEWAGPGGETSHLELSRPPAVHPSQLWRWVYEVEKSGSGEGGGGACLEDEWGRFGFGNGNGKEAQDDK
jgi:hypothetical protein